MAIRLPGLSRSKVPTLPYSRKAEKGWDRLWEVYHKREPSQLRHQDELSLPQLPSSREEMIAALSIGCPPEALRDRVVLEVGSGSGFLGKRIARSTKLFIGIEWSGVALDVARRTCPDRSVWIHVRDAKEIERYVDEVDTVVARHFMIHQPFQRAVRLLRFERALLRAGGCVYADFWFQDPERHDGKGVYPAAQEVKVDNAVYAYSDEEIAALADETGLKISEDITATEKLRRFVTFTKESR